MEEQQFSLVAASNAPAPATDSDSSIHQYPIESALNRIGLVNQRNGRWGAYLCANNEHFWLGSFKSEEEAAFMAHKRASIEFCDAAINKPYFGSHFTTDEVINMIMDGSYATEFSRIFPAQVQHKPDLATLLDTLGFNLRGLFMKVLTPSDVGKLNRLVIPKRYAVKHFPRISDDEALTEDVELVFFDMSMKSWKFRYCYWKSSESYVFTRGWNNFSKEKGLKPKDKVIFSGYEREDGLDEVGKLRVIDVTYNHGAITDNGEDLLSGFEMGQPGDDCHENKEVGRMDEQHGLEEGVKLFGVKII